MWTFDCANSLIENDLPFEVYSPADESFIGKNSTERLACHWHVWTRSEDQWSAHPISYVHLLDNLHSFDAIIMAQYLSNDAFFDFYLNLCPDQSLFVVNLGHHGYLEKAKYLFPSNPMIRGIGISEYASTLDRTLGIDSRPLHAGIWKKHIFPEAKLDEIDQKSGYISLGRILPHKGFETAIQALLPLESLKIAGPSMDAAYLDFLNSTGHNKEISCLGRISEEEKKRHLSSARVLIAGSTDFTYEKKRSPYPELLGLVIVEAVAANTLVAASDLPPFVEVMEMLQLRDFVFRRNDPRDLRRVLDLIASLDNEAYLKLLQSCRLALFDHFLWDDFSDRVLSLFHETRRESLLPIHR